MTSDELLDALQSMFDDGHIKGVTIFGNKSSIQISLDVGSGWSIEPGETIRQALEAVLKRNEYRYHTHPDIEDLI